MTKRTKWLGPWKLDREQGVWRRRMSSPLVVQIPLTGTYNAGSLGAFTTVGIITHPNYAERVVPLKKARGRASEGAE